MARSTVKILRAPMTALLLTMPAAHGCGAKDQNNSDAQLSPSSVPTSSVNISSQTSFYVADSGSLPPCITDRKASLAYVKSESRFYGCDGSNWAIIEIKGEKGETGAAGRNGVDGAGFQVEKLWHCPNGPDFPSSLSVSRGSYARITKFSSGDFFMTCESAEWSTSSDFYADTHSSSAFYPSTSAFVTGLKVLSCVPMYVVADFDLVTNKVTYSDSLDSTKKATVACNQVFSSSN